MPPAPRTELEPSATCRACGRPLAPGSAVCAACGAAHGESKRCPHCSAVADVEPHPALGFRCLVCGGPRVALDVTGVLPGAVTNAALERAGKHQTEHLVYSAAGWVLTAMGALSLVIAALVVLSASPGWVPTLAVFLGALVPVAAGVAALARASGARKRRAEALRAAEVSALGDVQAVTGLLDSKRAGEILRVSPERAELLLAEASVAALLEPGPAPRLRVPGAAPTELGDLEQGAHERERAPGRATRGDTEI